MFSLLVRRDGLIDPPELGETDAHCHILPGIDDGPTDERGTLAIARLLIEMGVRHAVATPHVISDVFPNSTETIVETVERVKRLLAASGLDLSLSAGAEYYAEPDLLQRISSGDLLSFGLERYVLFEAPVERAPMLLEEAVFSLKSAGYTPLLAHAERYRFLQGDEDAVQRLRELGVRFQVNHPSFLLPKTSRRGEMARRLYIKGRVDVLGTDMHRAASFAHRNAYAELRRQHRLR
ncbi:MAG: capsular biosynthesis protein [Deltaproteobacteria bacterium]|nr:capsular biosynthesis protein [Deltaproteobacteria bacterium]